MQVEINEVYELIEELVNNAAKQNDVRNWAALLAIGNAVKTLEKINTEQEQCLSRAKNIIKLYQCLNLEVQE
jgi:hypothetical protein